MKALLNACLFVFLITVCAFRVLAQIVIVNGASFDATQPIAGGSFATAFGRDLCVNTVPGDWIGPGLLPMTLGGCSVMVNGSAAMIQYVSPGQINFIVPSATAPGPARVTINNGKEMITASTVAGPAGPGMFAMNGMGMGEGAMLNGVTWHTGPFSTTTSGQSTYLSVYVTGLDLSTQPSVTIGGMPVDVVWFGNAPGFAGLQQINIMLPASMAGVGRVPVMVASNGQTSNVTFMHILPTTDMMQGMPGWQQGMMMANNMARGHEMSSLAFNASNNTALVADENDDAVRVISISSKSTLATITLPEGSQAHGIAVNEAGSLAAVTLSGKASIALIDLSRNSLVSVIGTGYYPSRVVFSGSNILVTNSASGTLTVLDSSTGATVQTVNTGFGPTGVAVAGKTAVVANMQAGSISLIDLISYAVNTIPLPQGSRPYEVAASGQANKAVITLPMSNSFAILDLATRAIHEVRTNGWNGMGPREAVIDGTTAYVANQMTATVTAADIATGTVLKTIQVDPGPVGLAVSKNGNQLLVLAEGTGTLDVIDVGSGSIASRIDAGATERQGKFVMPFISSITPAGATVGTSFTMTISGSGFQDVHGLSFYLTPTPNVMMGGSMGGQEDPNIQVSNFHLNDSGNQVTATIQILAGAAAGTRHIRLETSYGDVMGMMADSQFTITK